MTNLKETLLSLIELLDRLSIPYAVMGGVAVRAYGVPRPTYDIDLTLVVSREDLPNLFEHLRDFNYSIPAAYKSGWVDDLKGLKLLKLVRYMEDKNLDVDLFLSETEFQAEVMKRRCRAEAEGQIIWLVSPEDLILLKLLAGRPRDLGDVTDVLFMQGQLDVEYMRRWAVELGIADDLERAFTEFPNY